jgi:hypothetical protein
MAAASVNLQEFQDTCDVREEMPPEDIELSQQFTLDAGPGTIKFSYPEGWETRDVDPEIVVFSAQSEALEIDFTSPDPPVLEEGQRLVLVTVADAGFFGESSTDDLDPVSLLEGFAGVLGQQFGVVGETSSITLNDRRAAEVTFLGDTFEMQIVLVELGRDVRGQAFGLFIGISAPDDVASIAGVARDMAETAQLQRS